MIIISSGSQLALTKRSTSFNWLHSTYSIQHHFHSSNQPIHSRNSLSSSKHLNDFYLRKLHKSTSIFNKALTDELKRLTETNQRNLNNQSNLGPFRISNEERNQENLINDQNQLECNQIKWNEKIKRVFRNLKNLLIVGFGGSLGILVIYSITSELFAPSSSTNLMNSITETLNRSKSLQEILKSPYKFNTSNQANRSKRIQNSNQNLPQHVEIRFMIEGSSLNFETEIDLLNLEWWKMMMKRWISPLITSEVQSPRNHHPKRPNDELITEKDSHSNHWFYELIGSLSLKERSLKKKERVSWSERRLHPSLGTYTKGEVTAEIIKEVGGEWKYKSLLIDFPNSNLSYYRLDILNEIRKMENKSEDQEEKLRSNRSRFWNRRINV